jgi:glutathione synthase/RimK-type ligase-like ATP-grasp enzyme
MIVIVDHLREVHGRVVAKHLLGRGQRVFLADPHELGAGAELSHWPSHPARSRWRRRDGRELRLQETRAIWLRPKRKPSIPDAVTAPIERRFMEREWHDLMNGALVSLDVPTMNEARMMHAASKPHQLVMARRVGLTVPDTLMSNSASDALEFLARTGDVVHKTLTPPEDGLLVTKRWEEADRHCLDELVHAPTIFQRRVDGTREIRATVVGEQVFAAEVDTPLTDARLDLAALHGPHALPPSVTRLLVTFVERLGLSYAAIDLRLDARGEYQFLELNPAGQFLWIEVATGLPIAAAVADWLCAAAERAR